MTEAEIQAIAELVTEALKKELVRLNRRLDSLEDNLEVAATSIEGKLFKILDEQYGVHPAELMKEDDPD